MVRAMQNDKDGVKNMMNLYCFMVFIFPVLVLYVDTLVHDCIWLAYDANTAKGLKHCAYSLFAY